MKPDLAESLEEDAAQGSFSTGLGPLLRVLALFVDPAFSGRDVAGFPCVYTRPPCGLSLFYSTITCPVVVTDDESSFHILR